jgi:crotonobetainyl-CoA:carnitine CoA-transferase CaiB-like acyl-CoA transferase
LFADAGADVVLMERTDHPLRGYRSGLLFEYLSAGKRSVADDRALLAGADLLITESPQDVGLARVVVTVTPFGVSGPYASRPATEFTLQAACGSIGGRGLPEDPPIPAGNRMGEWLTGTFAAVAALAALRTGQPEHVDVAMLDCMTVAMSTYPSVFAEMTGWPPLAGTGRRLEVPSVLPTSDGFVNVTTNSATQFQDFCLLIGRPDWLDDDEMRRAATRFSRRDEFLAAAREYTTSKTTEEVLADASDFRIPAGPVLGGGSVADFEQFVAREVFRPAASGRFRQPRPPYLLNGQGAASPDPAPHPRLDSVNWAERPSPAAAKSLPLEGVRILDATAWWAGPAATSLLGALGADVIKIESVTRPDLMRYVAVRPPDVDRWWEWGPVFHGANLNKRGITLDLTSEEGRELFASLAKSADVVVENYTPRVMEQFGLGWDELHELNSSLIMVRMPGFGLDGPWRDRTGFAQTMEAVTGLAWLTGQRDGPPVLVGGACDPLAGMHAVFATLLALRQREITERGVFVEATMVEAALNTAMEPILEHEVNGRLLTRQGARSDLAAPQGVYRCAGEDCWVAIAVADDSQWRQLARHLGWPNDPELDAEAGRRAHHDLIDHRIGQWCATRDATEIAQQLSSIGVPAEAVIAARDVVANPQLQHRGLFETEHHPLAGKIRVPTVPFRFSSVSQWLRRPAPTLGQHNDEVLGEVADAARLERMRAAGRIGDRVAGGN